MIEVNQKNRLKLWLQWIVANALGELVGLGTIGVIGLLIASNWGESVSKESTIFFALLMIILGAFEGAVIGFAQWLVLRRIVNRLSSRSWVLASLIGATSAWILGMLPSTIISLSTQEESSSPDFNDAQIVLLAVVMGVVLGIILALPQWMVLHKYARRAGWWFGANSIAWAFGIPLIFLVAGTVPEDAAVFQIIVSMLLTVTAAAGIVGAIHGLVLMWVISPKRSG